jgi:hypothetical protein
MKYIKLFDGFVNKSIKDVLHDIKLANNLADITQQIEDYHDKKISMFYIMKDIQDIFLELKDIGLILQIIEIDENMIKFDLYKENGEIKYEEISEDVERVKDYMTSNGFKVVVKKLYFGILRLKGVQIQAKR